MMSRLGLGTVKFGRNSGVKYPTAFDLPDIDHLRGILDLARDLGINHLDTAPSYGLSEERLGALLAGRRQDWIITGKVGEEFENGESTYIFTPDHFEKSLTRSLKRLGTDYIDVLLIHSDGNDTAILEQDDIIDTMQGFKKRGLVRAIGASTKTVSGGVMALERMDCAMVAYNPAYRDEEAVIDHAAAHKKGILIKKGLMSGHIDQLGSANGDPVRAAMDFIFAHPGVTALITGTINPDHLRANAAAVAGAGAGA